MNRPDQAAFNWSEVPMNNVERVEVLRGPAGVLYGDHAVAGVINIITRKSAEEMERDLSVQAGSHGFHDESAAVRGSIDGLGYAASINHQSADGYRDHSRYDTKSAALNLEYGDEDAAEVYFSLNAAESQYQLPGALKEAEMDADREQSQPFHNDNAEEQSIFADFGIRIEPGAEQSLLLDIGYGRRNINAEFHVTDPFWAYDTWTEYKIDRWTASPKYRLTRPLGRFDNELLIGTDVGYERLDTEQVNRDMFGTTSADAHMNRWTVGAYALDSLYLSDELIASLGGRREKYDIDFEESGSAGNIDESKGRYENAFHGGLTWLPHERLKLFTRYEEFYRFPSTDEQAAYYGYFGVDGFNANIEPESGRSYEAGCTVHPLDTLELEGTVFRMEMKDEIAFDGATLVNYDDTLHQGLELAATYRPADWVRMKLWYTLLEATFTEGVDDGKDIPLAPQNEVDLNMDFFLDEHWTLNTHFAWLDNQFVAGDTANAADGLEAYALFDAFVRYKTTLGGCEVEAFAGAENIFEEEYVFYASNYGADTTYYPAPERVFKGGVSVRF
ncbi:TonB-dependent receptor [Kiritimatiella glycovorans]|uniref:Iron(III) dicitrate transport protein FecA n=1 Tax=Kiritimatiella glycovorans TaxID=1307763 RepID=A0A0G3ED25_9BACT|nr:TonB-dependent receptor [Kiritimatiella glycovorans]AKJ64361.1 Iron(III) dicitrate transport protein FecA [Kiritimatiella glycovorans]